MGRYNPLVDAWGLETAPALKKLTYTEPFGKRRQRTGELVGCTRREDGVEMAMIRLSDGVHMIHPSHLQSFPAYDFKPEKAD
jgi:hypothetical protein